MNTWSWPVSKPAIPPWPWPLGICCGHPGGYVPEAPTPVTDVSSCFQVYLSAAPLVQAGKQASRLLPTELHSQRVHRCNTTPVNDVSPPAHFQGANHRPSTLFLPIPLAQILNPACASNRTVALWPSCESLYPIRRPSLAHLAPRADEPAIPQRNHTDLYVAGHHDGMVVFRSVVRSGRADQ